MTSTNRLDNDQRLFTVNSGATVDRYVTYLSLDGTQQSVKTALKEDDQGQLNRNIDYTVMLWFKPMQWPMSTTNEAHIYQYLFDFEGSLHCYLTSSDGLTPSIMCEGIRNCEKLAANGLTQLSLNEWTHITLTGKRVGSAVDNASTGESNLLIETNRALMGEDSSSYIQLQQVRRPFLVCLGGCSPQQTFIGGLREFLVMNRYLTREEAMRGKNQVFYQWESSILGYYRFTEESFLKDYFRQNKIDVTLRDGKQPTQSRDLIPNDICYPDFDYQLYHEFTQISTSEVAQVSIDQRWVPSKSGWAYTQSMWLFIRPDSCFEPRAQEARNSCFFSLLQDAHFIFQPAPNEIAIYFLNDKLQNQIQSKSVFVPQNQWINIQATMNQYQGYVIQVYDMSRRLISSASEKRDLQPQTVRTKQLQLLRGFRGLVKAFGILTERVTLPYFMPAKPQVRNTCLGQVHFAEDGGLGTGSDGRLVNFCLHSSYQPLTFKLTSKVNLVGYYSPDSQTQTYSKNAFFDGIACNDANRYSLLSGAQSYLYTSASNSSSQATVEFWFKIPSQSSSSGGTLFHLSLSESSTTAIMAITLTNAQLFCSLSNNKTVLVYKDYQSKGNLWSHITCSFGGLGTLFQQDSTFKGDQFQYSSSIGASVPAGKKLELYIGNSRSRRDGPNGGLLVKEFRLWNQERTLDQIRDFRYQQLDPRTRQIGASLVAYVRLSEPGYRFYNLAQPSSAVEFKGLQIASNNSSSISGGLVICPLSTYYDDDLQRCYQDPFQKVILTVQPIINGYVEWIFDASDTITTFKGSQTLQYLWEFIDDPLAQAFVKQKGIARQSSIQLPSTILRDEVFYTVQVKISNADNTTQSKVKRITFVPINCQYYTIKGQSQSAVSRSAGDILFVIDLVQITSYCHKTTFFNSLDMNSFTYDIVPSLAQNPRVTFSRVNNQQVLVTIPKEEQYKFDLLNGLPEDGFKLIIQIPLQNSIYNYSSTSGTGRDLTFQNVVANVKFASEKTLGSSLPSETVVPVVKVLNENGLVLRGENAVLDASETYISSSSGNNATSTGLSFTWICPSAIAALCQGRQGKRLEITQEEFMSTMTKGGGQYRVAYIIQVRVEWTRKSGVRESFKASATLQWIELGRPKLSIKMPESLILVTSAQPTVFKVQVEETNNVTYSIDWSFQPPINSSSIASKALGLWEITVSPGGLQQLTNYTLQVSASNPSVPQVKSSVTRSFSTLAPPYGGQVGLEFKEEPNLFDLRLSGWKSYSSNMSFSATQQGTDLTQGWKPLSESTKFTLALVNISAPVKVLITDLSGEVYSQSVIPPSKPPAPQPVVVNNTANPIEANITANSSTNSSQINTATFLNVLSDTSSSQPEANSSLSTGEYEDLESLKYEYSENESLDQNIANAQSVLQSLRAITARFVGGSVPSRPRQQVNKILRDIAVLESLFADEKIRDLYQSVMGDLGALSDDLGGLKNLFISHLCKVGIMSHSSSRLSLEMVRLSSVLNSTEASLQPSADELRVTVHPKPISDLLQSQYPSEWQDYQDSICIYALFSQAPEYPKRQLRKASANVVELGFAQGGVIVESNSDQILQETGTWVDMELSNALQETKCMGIDTYSMEPLEELCLTEIAGKSVIRCKCSLLRSQALGLWTDLAPKLGANQGAISTDNTYVTVSFGCIMIIGMFALTLIAKLMDKSDEEYRKARVFSDAEQLILQRLQQETPDRSADYWISRMQDVEDFNKTPWISDFSLLYSRTQPLISVYRHSDPEISRLARLALHQVQISLFALLVTLCVHFAKDHLMLISGLLVLLCAPAILMPLITKKLRAWSLITLHWVLLGAQLAVLQLSDPKTSLYYILPTILIGTLFAEAVSPLFSVLLSLHFPRYFNSKAQVLEDARLVRSVLAPTVSVLTEEKMMIVPVKVVKNRAEGSPDNKKNKVRVGIQQQETQQEITSAAGVSAAAAVECSDNTFTAIQQP